MTVLKIVGILVLVILAIAIIAYFFAFIWFFLPSVVLVPIGFVLLGLGHDNWCVVVILIAIGANFWWSTRGPGQDLPY